MNDVLKSWESYYVIVGSSAGALTGLQFVVLTLITESGRLRGSPEAFAAFGSPNVVHFCAALLISALFSAPWHDAGAPGIATAVFGVCGLLYSLAVLRRARRQQDYKPVLEDWTWHTGLPFLAYAALVYAGFALAAGSTGALHLVAGAALLLVFVGIHNAWDTVMYVMTTRARQAAAASVTPASPTPVPVAAADATVLSPVVATAPSPSRPNEGDGERP